MYWFGLVWSAGKPASLFLSLACMILSLAQLYVLARPVKLSLIYVLLGVGLGVAMDTALSYFGVLSPARIMLPWPFVPVWLIGLWTAFVTYTRTGLDGMRGKYLLQAAAGFICGPLAWLGGGRMGAGSVHSNHLLAYGVMAVCWAIICVILFKLSDMLKVRDE